MLSDRDGNERTTDEPSLSSLVSRRDRYFTWPNMPSANSLSPRFMKSLTPFSSLVTSSFSSPVTSDETTGKKHCQVDSRVFSYSSEPSFCVMELQERPHLRQLLIVRDPLEFVPKCLRSGLQTRMDREDCTFSKMLCAMQVVVEKS